MIVVSSGTKADSYNSCYLQTDLFLGLSVKYPAFYGEDAESVKGKSKFRLESHYSNPATKRAFAKRDRFIYSAKYTAGIDAALLSGHVCLPACGIDNRSRFVELFTKGCTYF